VAGKYEHLIDKLPRLLGTEPKYQEKVELVKAAMLEELGADFIPAVDLAKTYADLRAEIDAIEAQLSEANLRLESTSQLMTEQFEVEGTSSLTIKGLGSIRTQYEPYSKVEDKEKFRLWCIKNGFEQSMVLPWQSTNSVTKERLLAGLPEPDGIVAHAKVKIVLTRQK
jgi:hypothetical protein